MDKFTFIIQHQNQQLYKNEFQTSRILAAKKFIEANFDQNLNLDIISSEVHCSKFHFNREFKRHYGITPIDFIREIRIKEAKKILQQNGSVTDACYGTGYNSLSTFCLFFRKSTGINASDFIRARLDKSEK